MSDMNDPLMSFLSDVSARLSVSQSEAVFARQGGQWISPTMVAENRQSLREGQQRAEEGARLMQQSMPPEPPPGFFDD